MSDLPGAAADFLADVAVDAAGRARLPIDSSVCTAGGFLFGGLTAATGLTIAESVAGRRCVWLTVQFATYVAAGETVDLTVEEIVRGRGVDQVRLRGSVGPRTCFYVVAATGSRDLDVEGQWVTAPEVPPPDQCPPLIPRRSQRGTVFDGIEVRVAAGRSPADLDGTPSDGSMTLWARLPGVTALPQGSLLAILGDYVHLAISHGLGRGFGANSLDNTLRIVASEPTDWVLVDAKAEAVHAGFAHCRERLFSQSGRLLAIASQSGAARPWPARPMFPAEHR